MLSNLPNEIIQYLVDELPPFTGVLIFRTDNEGKLIDFHGPHKEYLREKPIAGKPIHEYVPALYSMVPPMVSPMVLNKIQTNNSVYTDIHIVESVDNEYYIFFVNQSQNVEGIRDIIQKMNEEKFNSETKRQPDTLNSINPYLVFEDLVLELGTEDIAAIRSDVPGWFKQLSTGFLANTSIRFKELFPFLEVFMYEANEFWDKEEEGKLISGIWTESFEGGDDISLTAIAVMVDGNKFLLIRPLEEGIDQEKLAYQMAREQKLAYEKLEKAERKLKVLLDYKDKFVSIVSHDLRSPVAAVLGITELLVNDEDQMSKLTHFNREMIFNIKDEMIRLLDYNDKLYHWSNLELGNFEIVKENISLKTIIEKVERTFKGKFKSKNIKFSTNLADDITLNVDQTLFLQVLNNLVSNAVKFTPDNGSIKINVLDNNDSVDLIVSDSGVGMSPTVCENIFSEFTRNSTMGTDGEKGTGLGLGIVKKIIDTHGFKIRVESEIGKGSEFIITIPVF